MNELKELQIRLNGAKNSARKRCEQTIGGMKHRYSPTCGRERGRVSQPLTLEGYCQRCITVGEFGARV